VLKALKHCHQEVAIFHRDIKPDNIVINDNNEAVLINFGISHLVQDFMFYSPEAFEVISNEEMYSKEFGEK